MYSHKCLYEKKRPQISSLTFYLEKLDKENQTRHQNQAARVTGHGTHLFPQIHQEYIYKTSLVVGWLRIRLPLQETWVWFLVWEDPTWPRATKPTHHSPRVLQGPRVLRGLRNTTTEARVPTAHTLQQEKPTQGEAHTPQLESSPTHS